MRIADSHKFSRREDKHAKGALDIFDRGHHGLPAPAEPMRRKTLRNRSESTIHRSPS